MFVIADKTPTGHARGMSRRIALVAVPDAQVLDVAGPLEVFASASRELHRRGAAADRAYAGELVAPRAGELETSSGVTLLAPRALHDLRGPLDTLIVAGGPGVDAACNDAALLRSLRRVAGRAERLASVCTGAFLLAEAGLLEGRRVTTHWAACERLAERHPELRVDPDPIFVRDGHVWTSAGVTAGMDLALAMVESDHGREVAVAVARRLVLFLKRPGGQSQYSVWLDAQGGARDPLADVRAWIVEHPAADLSVEALARRAGMSPRHFARVFARETATTPARFVERARVEAARRLLEEAGARVDGVAAACGFGSPETLRRAFLRQLRVPPAAYRNRFCTAGQGAGKEARP